MSISGIASPFRLTEEQEPEREGKKRSQARIYQDERPQQLIFKLDAQKKPAGYRREQDAYHSASDPRREE